MKKSGFMKDAWILFAITLFAGIVLGAVYQVTKSPIEKATIEANNKAYKSVFNEAESFVEDDLLTQAIEGCNADLTQKDFGAVAVEKVLKAMDANGGMLGYVVTSLSNDSYGGVVKLSVGVTSEGSVTGIAFLEISDTPGLGLKAKDAKFKDQFMGKTAESLTVVKTGNAGDSEINSISGATITSKATTNAVNAALYYVHNCINE